MTDAERAEAAERRFRAKRLNEQIKAVYGFTNALGTAVIVVAFIGPALSGQRMPSGLDTPAVVLLGTLLHAAGQILIRIGWRSED